MTMVAPFSTVLPKYKITVLMTKKGNSTQFILLSMHCLSFVTLYKQEVIVINFWSNSASVASATLNIQMCLYYR